MTEVGTPSFDPSEPSEPSEPPSTGKRDFSAAYVAPDPRELFRALAPLEYQVPGFGAELFRRVIGELGLEGPLLDLCCSYGQDAALLNYSISNGELFDHYVDPGTATLARDELLARDRRYYADRRLPTAVPTVGLDASAPAVSYGVEAGLLDSGLAIDLEVDAPDERGDVDLSPLHDIGAIVVTGGISYVGPRTFDTLVSTAERDPWVAGMVLRWIDLEPVATTLRGRGYTVEVADDHPVIQRRIADEAEAEAMRDGLSDLGRSPSGLEEQGYHAAVPFVAVPSGTAVPPLHDLAHDIGATHV